MPNETPRQPDRPAPPSHPPAQMPPASQSLFAQAHRFTRLQLILAVVIAAISDGLSAFFTFAPPIVWIVDLVTAVLLFIVLGWHWLLLPGLIMEAIPGIGVIPLWLLVVTAIAIWGTARPKLNSMKKAPRDD